MKIQGLQSSTTLTISSSAEALAQDTGSAGVVYFENNRLKYTYAQRVWATRANMSIGGNQWAGGGTANAFIGFGGFCDGDHSQEYNGTSWSSANNMDADYCYSFAGDGSPSAAWVASGRGPNLQCRTSHFDGTSWSADANISEGKDELGGYGSQNAATIFGGRNSPFNVSLTEIEEYNGSSWSAGDDMSNGRCQNPDGAGTQNAGFVIGGGVPSVRTSTEEYNGTSWSAGGELPHLSSNGNGGSGTQNSTILASGQSPSAAQVCSLQYNGTAWSALGVNVTSYRRYGAQGGNASNTIIAGGNNNATSTIEFSATDDPELFICTL